MILVTGGTGFVGSHLIKRTIEPYLMHKERAAKFEQLVFIGKETVIL